MCVIRYRANIPPISIPLPLCSLSFIVPVYLLVCVSAFSFLSWLASLFVCRSAHPESLHICTPPNLSTKPICLSAFLSLVSHIVQFPVSLLKHLLICLSECNTAACLCAYLFTYSIIFTSGYHFVGKLL